MRVAVMQREHEWSATATARRLLRCGSPRSFPAHSPFVRSGALTQVKKKGRAVKDALVSKIREACQTYSNVFVFDVENMKNSVMKDVREEWKGSKSVRRDEGRTRRGG